MLTFKELLEAKIVPSLVKTTPQSPAERHFVDKHIKMDILKNFRQKGNDTMFNGKVVKTFPRKENHYGNDMDQSIIQYDESVETEKKHHIYVNGKWVGTTSWSKTNKDALHNYLRDHPGNKAKVTVAANVREED